MQELTKKTVSYAGVNMDRVVIGEYLQNNTAHRHIISYHDGCSAHAADCERRRWCISGKGGKMGDKSRGPCRMVAAYVSDAVGLWTESKRIIEPGIAENKDDYWGGEDTFATPRMITGAEKIPSWRHGGRQVEPQVEPQDTKWRAASAASARATSPAHLLRSWTKLSLERIRAASRACSRSGWRNVESSSQPADAAISCCTFTSSSMNSWVSQSMS
ncbi:hypothetical protein B484DRAFT_457951 [Ochromonadaceae sp. CCMP2298]|nr:hypothetical protein B484DRAFT_457951 [Ochromonadaceae sp. CCMP2298]